MQETNPHVSFKTGFGNIFKIWQETEVVITIHIVLKESVPPDVTPLHI
jgi:hypothetical protein